MQFTSVVRLLVGTTSKATTAFFTSDPHKDRTMQKAGMVGDHEDFLLELRSLVYFF
jgi:hypothetical protein